MKNTLKIFAIGLLIFILLSIVIASWYTLSLNYLTQYNFKDIIKIFVQIGLVGAIIPSLTTLLIYYFILKINNKILLLILIIGLIIGLIFQVYWISINLFFYDINSSKYFFESLIEALM